MLELPVELRLRVLRELSRYALNNVALTCQALYLLATPMIWAEVNVLALAAFLRTSRGSVSRTAALPHLSVADET